MRAAAAMVAAALIFASFDVFVASKVAACFVHVYAHPL